MLGLRLLYELYYIVHHFIDRASYKVDLVFSFDGDTHIEMALTNALGRLYHLT